MYLSKASSKSLVAHLDAPAVQFSLFRLAVKSGNGHYHLLILLLPISRKP